MSTPIKRNGATNTRSSSKPANLNDKDNNTTQTSQSKSVTPTNSQTHPLLPTSLETLLLAIYPTTLILGSLFSLLDPAARSAPYSALSQSHPPEYAPSYFAQKRNLFNVYFVKIGWFWTTLAFSIFVFLHPSTGPSGRFVLTPRRLQGFIRWALVTLWWALVTQWFFGPALIDRGFRLTGGQCDLVLSEEGRMKIKMGDSGARELLTSAACKAVGGSWKGGYDISGHVFLLVLGSAFLWLEILPVVLRHAGVREERRIRLMGGGAGTVEREKSVSSLSQGNREEDTDELGARGGVSAPLAVAGLSWWMLLMTAAYFHTWFEKFTGLLVAFVGIATVYFLPRAVPLLRRYVGMPGL